MRLAVREQPIKNNSENWEDEDNEAPQQLVRRGAARLEDLDCGCKGCQRDPLSIGIK